MTEDNCTYSTSTSQGCYDDGSGMRCEKQRRVFRQCPGKPLEEIENETEASEGAAAGGWGDRERHRFSFSSHGGGAGGGEGGFGFGDNSGRGGDMSFPSPEEMFDSLSHSLFSSFFGMGAPSSSSSSPSFPVPFFLGDPFNEHEEDRQREGREQINNRGGRGMGQGQGAGGREEPPLRGRFDNFMRSFFGVIPGGGSRGWVEHGDSASLSDSHQVLLVPPSFLESSQQPEEERAKPVWERWGFFSPPHQSHWHIPGRHTGGTVFVPREGEGREGAQAQRGRSEYGDRLHEV
uniref:Uncharacterized protein n=1 Tax=Chromera velia CCMP2878 TaxID=1169474 RepID=A0A0G4HKQ3_9ALVE|eukprot:Cvel_28514.t1-p1 / transcript=Cvel_28514.t1 / gene=Cvel_28514 / organism=Chromera_velia_CCMP2878 / gene_product=hypothetical protein / transcript_product=hypothetical protein / location=Cvel_scaffold3749:10366-13685(+) / protein_length=290 / sequence_SO=supercontig / SO=protein_coding / is_pseudo=false